ncbi:MAG: A/G-specific adenine glycosylase [Flavobacteriales bacterium]|nr:A/G-specific adenine glycosylase [Flavobacteriales bacterium]
MIFQKKITEWYHKNKRDLPWRNTTDPYKVWISEIILQQTKVSQGLPYYNRFIMEFPTITDLANAKEDHVLKIWQGLGYYSRARNLHFTARLIRDKYHSIFPSDYKSIKELKGVGDYTSAAISSFCFKLPYAVLDGNVFRLLSRYFAIDTPIDSSDGKKTFKKISQELICHKNPDIYNQAIMEFGAIQCIPKNPSCSVCVLNSSCKSYGTELVELLPIKSKSLKVSNKYFNYIIFNLGDNTFIHKRNMGIWKSLYQFPLIEGEFSFHEIQNLNVWKELVKQATVRLKFSSLPIKHKLSHQLINAVFHHVEVKDVISEKYLKIRWSKLDDYPLPRLIDKYLESLKK